MWKNRCGIVSAFVSTLFAHVGSRMVSIENCAEGIDWPEQGYLAVIELAEEISSSLLLLTCCLLLAPNIFIFIFIRPAIVNYIFSGENVGIPQNNCSRKIASWIRFRLSVIRSQNIDNWLRPSLTLLVPFGGYTFYQRISPDLVGQSDKSYSSISTCRL